MFSDSFFSSKEKMLIKNLETLHLGVWLGTDNALKKIIVWNTRTNTKESWDLDTTECHVEEEPLLLERENDFFNLLETMTSPRGLEVINENELLVMVTKSIKYFLDAGCLSNNKTLEASIEAVQEVMYNAIGDQPCGKTRDEVILFIHQKIPSILQGAYWGYTLSKLPSLQSEQEDSSETQSESEIEPEDLEPKKEKVIENSVSSAPYYGCCRRFCFQRQTTTRIV